MVEEFAEKLRLVARQEHAAGEVLKECECGAEKRGREEGNVESRDSKCRKQKVEEPLEEVKTEGARLGPKVFRSSTEMYQYFLKLQSGSQQDEIFFFLFVPFVKFPSFHWYCCKFLYCL